MTISEHSECGEQLILMGNESYLHLFVKANVFGFMLSTSATFGSRRYSDRGIWMAISDDPNTLIRRASQSHDAATMAFLSWPNTALGLTLFNMLAM